MRLKRRQLSFETLEARQLLAADPIITEFMASNDNTIEDGNGATPDWIEIYNNGDASVDLAGYRLTDDPGDTNKWVFPSTVLAPEEYLVVFASGNNVPDSAGYLHTNFSLQAGGEYVALVDPGGVVLSEFGPGGVDYPEQSEDASYGLAFDSDPTNPITPINSARYLIPSDDSVDALWTDAGFDDSSWQSGPISMGYETSGTNYTDAGLLDTLVPAGTTTVYVRAEFTIADADTLLDRLQLKYDDGFIAYINGVLVASDNAPGVPAYDSVATTDRPDGIAINYADFDISSYSYALNVGANVLAIHALNKASSSDMLSVPNLLLTSGGPIEPSLIGFLADPTPGLPNTNLRASDVAFSRVGGAFTGSFQLTMSAGPGETIRYTTDGTNPDENSPTYTGPITVNSTVQYRARAYGSLGQVGGTNVATYVSSTFSVTNFNSDLPVIVLENFGSGLPDREFQDSSFALYDVDPNTGRSSLSNPADIAMVLGQHRRGKSTYDSQNDKPNLRIELRDEFGADKNISLLGMPSESDWILYAPWTIDRAMVRHALIYDLSRQAGNWAPRTRFVEVYSNFDGGTLSDNDYRGVYVLMEVIKRDDSRVDIEELTPTQNSAPELTGGYILQIDEESPNDESWLTSRGTNATGGHISHSEPERIDLTQTQVDYIRDYVQDAEDALFGPNSTDPVLGYQAYFDVDAAVDFHLFNVFSGNPDAFRLSTYLTKDRDGKLAFGPLWDFDRGMGPDEDNRAEDPTKWMVDENYFWVRFYFNEMLNDPNFLQKWVDRWHELRQTVFSNANLESTLLGMTDQLTESQIRNEARYPGPAPNGGPLADPGDTGWEGEVSHLKNWLTMRGDWIDTLLITPPSFSPSPGNLTAGTQVALSAPGSTAIYYTLDGSDPRTSGGGVSPSALVYTGPISINQSTPINARAFGTSNISPTRTVQWSGLQQGLFSVEVAADATNLRITELQYHPANPTPAELALVPGAEDDDFEFIELLNIGNDPISLNSVRFTDGISFDFSTGNVTSLAPGETVVVVENLAAFDARYGNGMLIAGQYSGSLSNGGEQIILLDINDQVIHDFTYSDDAPWPTIADGDGPSLEVLSTAGNYSSSANWRASTDSENDGTPGEQTPSQPGDFDGDSTVTGLDFLAWQRGFGTTYDSNDLDIWESNYGQSSSATTTTQSGFQTSTPPLATGQSLEPISATRFETEVNQLETHSQVPLAASVPTLESITLPADFFIPNGLSMHRLKFEETEEVLIDELVEAIESVRPTSKQVTADLPASTSFHFSEAERSSPVEEEESQQSSTEWWETAIDEVFSSPGET